MSKEEQLLSTWTQQCGTRLPLIWFRQDPLGWGGDPSRGAALGRRNRGEDAVRRAEKPLVLQVARIPLDEGGYDNVGTYWSHEDPLYYLWSEAEWIAIVERPRSWERLLEQYEDHRLIRNDMEEILAGLECAMLFGAAEMSYMLAHPEGDPPLYPRYQGEPADADVPPSVRRWVKMAALAVYANTRTDVGGRVQIPFHVAAHDFGFALGLDALGHDGLSRFCGKIPELQNWRVPLQSCDDVPQWDEIENQAIEDAKEQRHA